MRRPRVLRDLRIDEVSSVDKGAGDGVRIVLMKRNDSGIDFAKIFGVRGDAAGDVLRAHLLKQQARDRLQRKQDDDDEDRRLSIDDLSDDDDGSGNGGGSAGGRHLEHLADLICQSRPDVDRASALRWLLNSKNGRALFARTMKRKEQQMQQPQTFERLLKNIGIERIAKAVVADGHGSAITEHEYTEAVTALAVTRYPTLKRDVAFSRLFGEQSPEAATLRKAHAIIKGMPMMVVVPVATEADDVDDDDSDAIEALEALAEEQRRRSPDLTKAQAFSRVYQDPANIKLVKRERHQNRPRAG